MTGPQGHLRAALLAALLAVVVALIVAPNPAQAADPPVTLGTLTLDPVAGQDITPITLTTVSSGPTKGCPIEAPNVGGVVTGPGGWAAGITAISNTDTGVSQTADFSVPLQDTFVSMAATNGLSVLAGRYTITMYCQDIFGLTQLGQFATSLWFTDSTHYQTTDPAVPTPTSTVTTSPTPSPTTTATPPPTPTTTNTATPVPTPTATTTTAPPGAPPALGSLSFDPPTGGDITPITLTTVSSGAAKGCPIEAPNVGGVVTGPGGWAAGITAITNTDAGVSQTADFSVPLQDTFVSMAATNGLSVLAGRYTITMYCQDIFGVQRLGAFSGSLWFTDPTHYQSTDPDSSQSATEIVVTASPEDRSELGRRVTLTAAVTPASAAGSVQFRNSQGGTFGKVGPVITVADGKATYSSTAFGFALYQFSAVFTPSDPKKLLSSTSRDLIHVVALPIPPVPRTGAAVTGTVRVGRTVGCTATFTGAKSRRYEWIRGRTTVVGTTPKYRLVRADGGQTIRCRALATNAGGTTSRTSAARRVAR